MKLRYGRTAALLLAGTALAGLAMAQGNSQGNQGNQDDQGNIPEIIKHKPNPKGIGEAPPVGSTGVITPAITNHGGPMIGTPSIYFIWYGNWANSSGSDTPAGKQILRDLAYGIGGSPYFQINTSYSTSSTTITGGTTGFSSSHEATDNYSQGTKLSDAGVLAAVNTALAKVGGLPYDPNGVYFVLTSSDVSEKSGFCNQYCGWHWFGNTSKGKVRYAFVGNANRCLSSCAIQSTSPNGNAGVDGMASVVAHELEEATTDAEGTAWYDKNGAENADKCAWTFGTSQLLNGAYYNMTLPTEPGSPVGTTRRFEIQRNLRHTTSGDFCALQ